MEIPDSFIIKALANAIDNPGAEARAVKLAKEFRQRHPELLDRAARFTQAVQATLAGVEWPAT